MLAGAVHRMVGRADADKAGDVAEFGDARVGNVAQPFAIGIIAKLAVQNPRPAADLGKFAKGAADYQTVLVNIGIITKRFSGHQSSPFDTVDGRLKRSLCRITALTSGA